MKSNLEKIAAYQAIMPKKQGESICHSAVLECEYGSQTCVLNLERSHGRYIGNNAQIDKKDGKNVNFGYCSKLDEPCRARLSDWYHANEEDLMFDERTLKMEPSVQMDSGFMVCSRGYAIVQAVTSGQTIGMPSSWDSRNNVYITKDNKYIVVDGIKFEIYVPQTMVAYTVTQEWYDVDTWDLYQRDFDEAKAALGVVSVLSGFDISLPSQKELTDRHGYHTLQDGYPQTTKATQVYKDKMTDAFMGQLLVNVLQAIANAIEYTYITFQFQVSNLRNYRVKILGGTKSETVKYMNYQYYDKTCSFVYDIVPDMFLFSEINSIRENGYSLIEDVVSEIKTGKNKSEILVPDEQLKIHNKEFYDVICKLNRERTTNSYQVYIYPNSKGAICQKMIVYSNEYLRIVKRKPDFTSYYGGTVQGLVEMIDALIIENINKDESNLFWSLFERALKEYNKKRDLTSTMDNLCETAIYRNLPEKRNR